MISSLETLSQINWSNS